MNNPSRRQPRAQAWIWLAGSALLSWCAPAQADPVTVYTAFFVVVNVVEAAAVFIVENAAVFAAAGSYMYANHQRKKAAAEARRSALAALKDQYTTVPMDINIARKRVYGPYRAGTEIVWRGTWGADDEVFTMLLSVAAHKVESIDEVYYGATKLTLSPAGWVQDAPWNQDKVVTGTQVLTLGAGGTGSVTLPATPLAGSVHATQALAGGGTRTLTVSVAGLTVSVSGGVAGAATVYYQRQSSNSKMRVRKYLGGAGQDLYPELVVDFPDLVSTDRFSGDAMLRVDMYYSPDAFSSSMEGFSASGKGALVMDPRTGLNAYSANLALLALDWAKYKFGCGLSAEEVDEDSFVAAANACDVSHTWHMVPTDPDFPPFDVTDKLYSGGMVIPLEGNPTEALSELCEAMAGRWGWSGGRLVVVAGAWRAPVLDLDESAFADDGESAVVPEVAESDAVNTFRITLANRLNDFVVAPLDPLAPTSYLDADGQELARDVEMQAVKTVYHGLHVGGVLMRESRAGLTLKGTFKLRHVLPLTLFDNFRLSVAENGWTLKTFELQSLIPKPGGLADLVAKETNATIYDPDADFSDLGWNDNTTLPNPSQVPAVEGLAVSSGGTELVDGSVITRTRVTWDAIGFAPVSQSGRIEVQYIEATAGVWAEDEWSSWIEQGASTSAVIPGLRTGRVYLFRARAATLLTRGQWCTQVAHRVEAQPAPLLTLQETVSSAPMPVFFRDDVITLTYTPPVDTDAIVTVEADMDFVNSWLRRQCGFSTNLRVNGNYQGHYRDFQWCETGEGFTKSFAQTYKVSLTGGVESTIGWGVYTSSTSGATGTASNVVMTMHVMRGQM